MLRSVGLRLHGTVLGHHRGRHGAGLGVHGVALVAAHASQPALLHRHVLRLAHVDVWYLSLHAHHLVLLHNEMGHRGLLT